MFMGQVLIPCINALIIHDGDGDRLFAKYYDGKTKAEQTELEQAIQKKTKNMTGKSEGNKDHQLLL